jgi:hypothetical protein
MPFKLPEGITFRKKALAQGFAYVFRHKELGDIGRIVLSNRPDDRCQLSCEVAGNPEGPMTATRKALRRPRRDVTPVEVAPACYRSPGNPTHPLLLGQPGPEGHL